MSGLRDVLRVCTAQLQHARTVLQVLHVLRELPLQLLVQADLIPLQSSNLASHALLDIIALLPQQPLQTALLTLIALQDRLHKLPVRQAIHAIKGLRQYALLELIRMLETESAQLAIRAIIVLEELEQSALLELTP